MHSIQGSRLRRPLIRNDMKTETWDMKKWHSYVHADVEIYTALFYQCNMWDLKKHCKGLEFLDLSSPKGHENKNPNANPGHLYCEPVIKTGGNSHWIRRTMWEWVFPSEATQRVWRLAWAMTVTGWAYAFAAGYCIGEIGQWKTESESKFVLRDY